MVAAENWRSPTAVRVEVSDAGSEYEYRCGKQQGEAEGSWPADTRTPYRKFGCPLGMFD
jgi:hypothetical protein